MATNRELQEAMAKSVATLVYYHQCEQSGLTGELMVQELQRLAIDLLRLTKSLDLIETHVIGPMSGELIACFGQVSGERLYKEFLDTFRRMMMLSRPSSRRAEEPKSAKLRLGSLP